MAEVIVGQLSGQLMNGSWIVDGSNNLIGYTTVGGVKTYFARAAASQTKGGFAADAGQFIIESFQDGVTAFAGGGKASATPITGQTARITTVATAGDSILLPASQPGLELYIMNHGTNAMQVYGAGTDTIDDVATGTGVSQMANSSVLYSCSLAGLWYTNGLATGYSGSYQTQSFKNGITAHAGGTQAGAQGDANAALPAMLNRITTVATIGDSTVLPTAVPGMVITVANAAANSMNVFPNTGDAINGGAANAAFAVAGGKTAIISCMVAGQWHAVLSA